MRRSKNAKPKYKPNPLFNIEEFCDTYLVYRSTDKDKETLCCTFNPQFNMIYVGKGRDEEAIAELRLFLESKNYKECRITYSVVKDDNETNLEDTENENETESREEEPVRPVRRRTRKTKK